MPLFRKSLCFEMRKAGRVYPIMKVYDPGNTIEYDDVDFA